MSIRPRQTESQASQQDGPAGQEQYRTLRQRSQSEQTSLSRTGQAHKVQINSDRNLHFSQEIASKADCAATATVLQVHECEAEQVSAVLTRLRKLASQNTTDDGLATPDLLAAADEYRGLRHDLAKITERIVSQKQNISQDRPQLTEGLERELTNLRDKLEIAVSTVPNLDSTTAAPSSIVRASTKQPILGQLDSTIEKVEEYHSYLQQVRNAVDTQLMKPLGSSQELRREQNQHRIRQQILDSQVLIKEKGAASLQASKPTDPKLALRLLDPTD